MKRRSAASRILDDHDRMVREVSAVAILSVDTKSIPVSASPVVPAPISARAAVDVHPDIDVRVRGVRHGLVMTLAMVAVLGVVMFALLWVAHLGGAL